MSTAEALPVDSRSPLRERAADEIRAMMGRRRMSGVKLAARIGRTQSYVSRRLTAEVAFDLDDLERIAAVFDMSFAQLMSRIDTEISWSSSDFASGSEDLTPGPHLSGEELAGLGVADLTAARARRELAHDSTQPAVSEYLLAAPLPG